ncbi:MAG: helix-turn-helix domain-containing protein [Gammaproteobacteria bacterium]
MNELEAVKNDLLKRIPQLDCDYDPGETESGSSWLDLRFENQFINIEWNPGKGFGLHLEDVDSYGSGPNEIYRNKDKLYKRIYMLFLERKLHLKLKELREIKGISQSELGELLGQKQASISKIETRENDVLIKTLCAMVEALGGTLEIKVHFDDFDVPLDLSCSTNNDRKLT